MEFSPCGVQELKDLRKDRLLSYVLVQRNLRIEFAHLIGKRQLHPVMEGLRQQSKSRAQDEPGYGSVNPGTVHRKAANKPRTTDAPTIVSDLRSQQLSGRQPGAGLPAPTSSGTRDKFADALERQAPDGSGALRFDQGGLDEPSHVFKYEALSQPLPSGPSTSGGDSLESLSIDEVCRLRDRVYVIDVVLGSGGQAVAKPGKPGALEGLRQDMNALGCAFRELHGRVDHRVRLPP
ncbi:Hypothetical protein PHPALM_13797 [Phytophthora palmivora]|uniref:ATP-binding cassette (ABC) Superfamily n=1 Tax=Phytophthora palmivora TaxID=4796 RepID=A0A2P4XWC6_9STRA|nr:Hypothetical protein PHPALM_13797 [Phytophthora palmivora]